MAKKVGLRDKCSATIQGGSKSGGLNCSRPPKISLWRTGDLKPNKNNARKHSFKQIEKIAASIAEFGFTNPILANSTGIIIAGHGRLVAAKRLGLSNVPVIILEHLSDQQRRALTLADNRLALDAEWEDAILAEELVRLQSEKVDLLTTGFGEEELRALLDLNGKVTREGFANQSVAAKFEVIAECRDEVEQENVHRLLMERGVKCRVLSM
jgi:ParB-like chromosome segregation protein Spo0J